MQLTANHVYVVEYCILGGQKENVWIHTFTKYILDIYNLSGVRCWEVGVKKTTGGLWKKV